MVLVRAIMEVMEVMEVGGTEDTVSVRPIMAMRPRCQLRRPFIFSGRKHVLLHRRDQPIIGIIAEIRTGITPM